MRKLLEQLEDMHIRVAESATHEEALIKALGDALERLDQQLLADVQNIASDHQARRTAILGELHGLASSIGMFQAPPASHAEIEAEPANYLPSAGDWRQATSNIAEDFDGPVTQPAGPRTVYPHEVHQQQQRPARVPLSLVDRNKRRAAG
jgi:hypothetical protein